MAAPPPSTQILVNWDLSLDYLLEFAHLKNSSAAIGHLPI